MREIKFRAWHPTSGMTLTPILQRSDQTGIVKCQGFDKSGNLLDLPLMQCTGLIDNNGAEIYEGDIVRILYTDWPSQSPETNGRYSMGLDEYRDSISNIGKVVFKDCSFCIQFNEDGDTRGIHCGPHGQIKVIGNIHENPELLEVPQ